jgi:hypothetical protein
MLSALQPLNGHFWNAPLTCMQNTVKVTNGGAMINCFWKRRRALNLHICKPLTLSSDAYLNISVNFISQRITCHIYYRPRLHPSNLSTERSLVLAHFCFGMRNFGPGTTPPCSCHSCLILSLCTYSDHLWTFLLEFKDGQLSLSAFNFLHLSQHNISEVLCQHTTPFLSNYMGNTIAIQSLQLQSTTSI